jgi:hypothetical protein
MGTTFPPKRDFRSLSVTDLLEARELYHSHLTSIENVVATAVGLYRIRKDDPDARDVKKKDLWRSRQHAPERTMENTLVQPWSWPCVLVFVKTWVPQEVIARQNPDQVVPRYLYMPDGRVVPTCVILARKQEEAPAPQYNFVFTDKKIRGGFPVFTTVQGQEHIGSVGCLVTDGRQVYALTNRHVAGEEGEVIYTFSGAERQDIGKSVGGSLGKKPFGEVYPGWPGAHVMCNLDAGLIRLDDVNDWSAQVQGIGQIDDPIDINTNTITLDLIGCPLRAHGGASGDLAGEIQALFYRYKSIGGIEYVSDLLIGTRDLRKPLGTRPGDSGTVWFYDEAAAAGSNGRTFKAPRSLRPLAVQWGGHVLMDSQGEAKLQFALATFLSTICRELDVDILRDWNIGLNDYWGKTGHYKIAATACEIVSDPRLKLLLQRNLTDIAFTDSAIESGDLGRIQSKEFVPLADVADLVWRYTRKKDACSHFADMDEPGKGDYLDKTLLQLCEDPQNVSIDTWNGFYDSLEVANADRGALPFRLWQVFELMLAYARAGKVREFVCAGGIVSHYVGDACNPLHVSRLHHGRTPAESPVHSKYETEMPDRFAVEIIAGVNQALQGAPVRSDIQTGKEAALAVIALMRSSLETLPPLDIIQAYNESSGLQRLPHMWQVLGPRTIQCLAAGVQCMACLWESAWAQGNGDAIAKSKIRKQTTKSLKSLYNDKTFLPAYYLTDPAYAAALGEPA